MDWKSFLVVTVGSVLVFFTVRALGGPEWLAWLMAIGWAIVVGRMGYRVG
ncbi:MAG: hypothetical protein M3220_17315 [Chloroflexota bacterium]|nr:hypothetical protein [Chloroflexota bacterium]